MLPSPVIRRLPKKRTAGKHNVSDLQSRELKKLKQVIMVNDVEDLTKCISVEAGYQPRREP